MNWKYAVEMLSSESLAFEPVMWKIGFCLFLLPFYFIYDYIFKVVGKTIVRTIEEIKWIRKERKKYELDRKIQTKKD